MINYLSKKELCRLKQVCYLQEKWKLEKQIKVSKKENASHFIGCLNLINHPKLIFKLYFCWIIQNH